MSNDVITRVRYFDRQYLRVQDFTDEQSYHLAMRRRHLIGEHIWGIVEGLVPIATDDGLFVRPGYAVDGYGRELVLAQQASIDIKAFETARTLALDVWLMYSKVSLDPAPSGYAGCGPTPSGTDYRWLETPVLRVEKPDPLYPDRRKPKGVPDADLDFSPARTPPDDPLVVWPVYLGQILRDPADPTKFTVDLSERPYAGAVAESIESPSGRVRVQIGAEDESDPNRFGIFLTDISNTDDQLRLAIAKTGEIELRGQATLRGDAILDTGALVFEGGPPPAEVPAPLAHSWKMYRFQDKDGTEELRIEIEAGAKNSFAIGTFSDQAHKFQPALTVDSQNVVTCSGNLRVDGQFSADKLSVSGYTQEAQALLDAGFLTGVAGAGNALLANPNAGVQLMVNAMADQNLRNAFAAALKAANLDAAHKLHDALQ